jgi:hypothetical protein
VSDAPRSARRLQLALGIILGLVEVDLGLRLFWLRMPIVPLLHSECFGAKRRGRAFICALATVGCPTCTQSALKRYARMTIVLIFCVLFGACSHSVCLLNRKKPFLRQPHDGRCISISIGVTVLNLRQVCFRCPSQRAPCAEPILYFDATSGGVVTCGVGGENRFNSHLCCLIYTSCSLTLTQALSAPPSAVLYFTHIPSKRINAHLDVYWCISRTVNTWREDLASSKGFRLSLKFRVGLFWASVLRSWLR